MVDVLVLEGCGGFRKSDVVTVVVGVVHVDGVAVVLSSSKY